MLPVTLTNSFIQLLKTNNNNKKKAIVLIFLACSQAVTEKSTETCTKRLESLVANYNEKRGQLVSGLTAGPGLVQGPLIGTRGPSLPLPALQTQEARHAASITRRDAHVRHSYKHILNRATLEW